MKRMIALILLCVFTAALLSGCGAKAQKSAEGTPTPIADETPTPQQGTVSEASAAAREEDFPSGDVALPDGSTVDNHISTLDLSYIADKDVSAAVEAIGALPALKLVELGAQRGGLGWDSVKRICDACGDVDISYAFTLYGKDFHQADTRMDLNHIEMDDDGELVRQAAACMPNLRFLDMDSCGVDNEHMAALRDSLPNTKVVWRIWFGEMYSVRTDVERVLASQNSKGGLLERAEPLKYCTDVKYIDLGYNIVLKDVEFAAFMPKLEVAVLAWNDISDLSPLAKCPNLEYLELQLNPISDLTPLSGLKNLKHLNVCQCEMLHDISPLYSMTQLERLWIGGMSGVPQEQIDEMRESVPKCLVNNTAGEPTEGQWRSAEVGEFFPLHPRYELLREQFGYYEDSAFSYDRNDPLY